MSLKKVRRPAEGTPPIYHDAAGFAHAAKLLAGGEGPFAVDAERASSFRYGERAFLIQIRRRNAGTVLIAPEANRRACADHLGPILSNETWILHSAHNDLPCLAELQMRPSAIIDTEIAALLLQEPRTGLGALVEENLGIELAKAHSNEDWSRWPVPRDWADYAALDVEFLHDLTDIFLEDLSNEGKSEFFEQENAHVLDIALRPSEPKTWRDIKGATLIDTARGQHLAARLEAWRQSEGARTDRSVQTILPNKTLIAIASAHTPPHSPAQLKRMVLGRRIPANYLLPILREIDAALAGPIPPRENTRRAQHRRDERVDDVLAHLRDTTAAVAEDYTVDRRCLPNTKTLTAIARALVTSLDEHGPLSHQDCDRIIREQLEAHEARPWQIDAITDPLAHAADQVLPHS